MHIRPTADVRTQHLCKPTNQQNSWFIRWETRHLRVQTIKYSQNKTRNSQELRINFRSYLQKGLLDSKLLFNYNHFIKHRVFFINYYVIIYVQKLSHENGNYYWCGRHLYICAIVAPERWQLLSCKARCERPAPPSGEIYNKKLLAKSMETRAQPRSDGILPPQERNE